MQAHFGTLIYNRILYAVIEENPEKNNKELTEEMAWEERQYIKLFFFFSEGFND